MILSFSRRFLFIKGQKVAGTSVEMALSTLCDSRDIVTPITQVDERRRIEMGGRAQNYSGDPASETSYVQQIMRSPLDALNSVARPKGDYANHMSLLSVLSLQPEAAALPVVFIERNPYAKVLSLANHVLGLNSYRAGGSMHAGPEELKKAAALVVANGRMKQVCNIDLYRGRTGQVTGTRLRYESVQQDFDQFVSSIAPGSKVSLPHAKRGVMANNLDPRDFFSRGDLDAVNDTFAAEFAAFDYQRI